ncbi:hypothetical protein AXX17_ATUG04470, partial [Arabidopsis thaliana]
MTAPQASVIRHMVLFDLKHAQGSAEAQQFLKDGWRILTSIPSVRNFMAYDQISAKNDYTYSFSMEFEDQDGYDRGIGMKIDLTGRTALVTGSTGQLGRVMARTLAGCGANLVLHYRGNEAKALELQAEIRSMGREASIVQADITKLTDVMAMKEKTAAGSGVVDIVVANAVIQYAWTSVLEQPVEDYVGQFESCVLQSVHLAKAFVPAMITQRHGRFIGINTECVMQNFPTQSAYVAGKRGMDGVYRVLAKEIGEHQITVNQVAPGWTISERDREENSERNESYEQSVPLKRRGTDQEIANVVAFLASDLASFITGAYVPNSDRFWEAVRVHVTISLYALLIAVVVCIPLGVLCAKKQWLTGPVMGLFNSLRVIPSLAILVIILPWLGTGFVPALVALTVLACPPILINTYLGFRSIEPSIIEAASGMGMSQGRILRKIEFPLSLPLLLTGVKTAAVEVIASATLAAFIGGGGLGTFIINGLGMYNFSLLLVGALPVAVLAIVSELGFAGITRASTHYQRIACGGKSGSSADKPTVKVGSKNFTESLILGEMYSLALENAGYKVERKLNLGGTLVAHEALKKGDIDMYPEYTGTGLINVLQLPPKTDAKEVYDEVAKGYKDKFNLIWLEPTNANDSQGLVTTKKIAEQYNLYKISDLPKLAPQLKLAAVPEFEEREDGLKGLNSFYGKMDFKSIKLYDYGIKYRTILAGEADVTVGFTTDGDLTNKDLVLLQDDKNFWPPYFVAPVLRGELNEKDPEIAKVLNKISAKLDNATVQGLNAEVDINKKEYADVAKDYLTKEDDDNMSKEAIVFDRVIKSYPRAGKPSVNETSLLVKQGEFVTILGTSGSGKTTLLKMVNRIIEPTSGTISVFGKDIRQVPLNELRSGIGYVIQQVGLFPHMTIEQNIATVPGILGWDKRKTSERVDELMELVQLPASFRKRYPRQLSGGQQQRVGIARAMAGDPSLLLMDEPFGAIDAITRTKLQEDLLLIQKRLGKTILFVTHDVDEAFKLGDRVIVMNEGSIQQYGTPFELVSEPANNFVRELIQGEDLFQLLKLTKAEDRMIELPDDIP